MSNKETLRALWLLALPTFGQLIAEPIFVLIDTAIVGHLGSHALAGLSIGSTVLLTAAGLCLFLAYNTTSQVARLLGSGNRQEGMSVGIDGLWLAFIIGVILTIALTFCAHPLCYAMGARGETLDNAITYTQTVLPGLPAILLTYAANGIFRGLQKVRITLFAAVSGAIINTIGDIVFVFGFHYGIAGSGIATTIAQWYMGMVLTIPVICWAKRYDARLLPHVQRILHCADSGIPLFIRTLALRVCMVATVVTATRLGTNTLAAYQVTNSCWNFVMNMLDAIGIAAQSIVASTLGANQRQQTHHITRLCARTAAAASMIIGVLLIASGWLLAPLFSPQPALQRLISIGLTILGLFLPLAGWMWALDGVLIGAGDHRYLAQACSIMAFIYLITLIVVTSVQLAANTNDITRTIVLWIVLNVVYIGGRAIGNQHRIMTDAWMDRAKNI